MLERPRGETAVWMLVGANGYTLNPRQPRFDALIVEDGVITAVGQCQELRLQLGARVDAVLDVEGATVLPGFVDSHLHVSAVGEQAMQLDLTGVQSKCELLQQVRERASALPPGAWLLGAGWDENRFDKACWPSRQELDEAAGGRPLVLTRVCHHAYLVNTQALQEAGLGLMPPDPKDGRFVRDERGEVAGLVHDNAIFPILRAIPPRSRAEEKQMLRLGMEAALVNGITAVHTDDTRTFGGFAATWTLYHELIHQDGVALRVHELVDSSFLEECRNSLADLPKPDEWLEVGAAKLFSDGALGGRTAWLAEDYTDAPGWRGMPVYSPEELTARVRAAHELGFAAAVHAIGDAALDMTLTALEQGRGGAGLPDRIVHAELVRPDLVRRMQALGDRIIVDIQPRFTVSDFPWVKERLGPARLNGVCAWRTLAEAGIGLCGGSDAPVEPINPLLGIHAAVTRRPPHAQGPGFTLSQVLDRETAIRLFTRGACRANRREAVKGVIRPGAWADLTVLSRDVLAEAEDALLEARVLWTVVGGCVAYAHNGRMERLR
ncbi:amidohydrolase [Alicyclobacillus shizuokensis]|uniref:amidohydrolase n=1 Tax=Alicyclobacillus shizuokensis TaxID=392014 RepID=UPI00082B95E7|nr:amidohydrolase [Alicyclobacillus shizuokensis]MCL6626355.1 amidohydrolase [Alicyclobacillus shizuokensis]